MDKYLERMSADELRSEISKLYQKFDNVRVYYEALLSPVCLEKAFQRSMTIIKSQFCPDRGMPTLKYSIARKAISDFKKVCDDSKRVVELELAYVEFGIVCTLKYGDVDGPFYNSLESMFRRALDHMIKTDLLLYFQERCRNICAETANLGWGFADAIEGLYEQYYR